VAVAIAVERRSARVVATDLSAAALDIARRNITRHGVRDRVECVQGDLLTPLTGSFDLIVANPPYVAVGSRTALQPEVRNFEPETALFGGADGLEIIRRLIADAPACLNQDGYLMFEFGDGQEADVTELISASDGLRMVDVRRDLQGIERVAIVRLKN
jgi:release factor glutamine methyltransferase